ncbi:hypothetical protein EJB05_23595 [Eragrostis curvula]|uniref:Cyanobacterial aminoacyl-tRNA synthetase CAAD domain-containing protein n=1 Tax=Eragrostis curvula TaxID=38414 RepID=A0A5J9VAJ5_9POAL|nr:hypothetical protein EJB05_23595 [Eragrostis curvula]
MAPTNPATASGARAVAGPVTTSGEGTKAAARSVGLGVPALPPLPGLGLAPQGQPRAAPFTAGEESGVQVVGATGGQQGAQRWDGIQNKYAVTTVAIAVTLGMWSAGAVVSAIDRLPVVPVLMETVGLGYGGVRSAFQDAFFAKIKEFYEDIISG